MSYCMKEKVIIVTGSGRGIGRGIALKFAQHGAKVVVATRTASHGRDTVNEILTNGGEASFYQTELQSKQAIDDIVSYTHKTYGSVDVAIHNAATALIEPLEDITEEGIEQTLTVNIKAGVWLTKAVVPDMREKGGGRILFTSSITAQRAIKGASAYAISKAGLNGFIRNAALELGKYKITVNGIEPGITKTDALDKHHFKEEELNQFLACIPLNCMGTPEDMAQAMLFLASDGASYITGQTIVIDGGMLLPENGALMIQGR